MKRLFLLLSAFFISAGAAFAESDIEIDADDFFDSLSEVGKHKTLSEISLCVTGDLGDGVMTDVTDSNSGYSYGNGIDFTQSAEIGFSGSYTLWEEYGSEEKFPEGAWGYKFYVSGCAFNECTADFSMLHEDEISSKGKGKELNAGVGIDFKFNAFERFEPFFGIFVTGNIKYFDGDKSFTKRYFDELFFGVCGELETGGKVILTKGESVSVALNCGLSALFMLEGIGFIEVMEAGQSDSSWNLTVEPTGIPIQMKAFAGISLFI